MSKKRAIGRPKPLNKPETQIFTLVLESKTAQWGKELPGGLSALVRQLLRDAYERAHKKS